MYVYVCERQNGNETAILLHCLSPWIFFLLFSLIFIFETFDVEWKWRVWIENRKWSSSYNFFCYNSRLFSFINLLSLLTFFAFINFINNFLQLICFSSTFSILIQFYEYLFEFKISTFILTDDTDSLLQKWCKWKINIGFHWTILKYFFLQKCWRKRHWQYNEKKKRKRI